MTDRFHHVTLKQKTMSTTWCKSSNKGTYSLDMDLPETLSDANINSMHQQTATDTPLTTCACTCVITQH